MLAEENKNSGTSALDGKKETHSLPLDVLPFTSDNIFYMLIFLLFSIYLFYGYIVLRLTKLTWFHG